MRRLTSEEQRSRLEEIAGRTDKKLFVSSLIQAAILVLIFTLLSATLGEDKSAETTGSAILKYLIIYCAAVAAWYVTSVFERSFARRRLKGQK